MSYLKCIGVMLAASIFFAACEKEEIPVEPVPREGIISHTFELGTAYRNQLWVDLATGEIRQSANLMDWDLALRHTDEGLRLHLNTARFMSAWKTPFTSLQEADDTTGFGAGKRLEIAADFHSNPAIDPAPEVGDIYLIDLGFSDIGLPLGLRWLQVVAVDETALEVDVRAHNSQEVIRHRIEAPAANGAQRFYSLSEDRVPPTEPVAFDLLFTKYTYAFVEPPVPYLVSGVLLNHRRVRCAVISDRDFADIALRDTANMEFTNQPDAIGYDWKSYNFDEARYTVDATRTYIIQAYSGYYYKLRFTDFYSPQGIVGFPTLEVQPL